MGLQMLQLQVVTFTTDMNGRIEIRNPYQMVKLIVGVVR